MSAAKKKPWKTGARNGHITNLKQSILETFDISSRVSSRIIIDNFYVMLPIVASLTEDSIEASFAIVIYL
jgi:hypothetical protein